MVLCCKYHYAGTLHACRQLPYTAPTSAWARSIRPAECRLHLSGWLLAVLRSFSPPASATVEDTRRQDILLHTMCRWREHCPLSQQSCQGTESQLLCLPHEARLAQQCPIKLIIITTGDMLFVHQYAVCIAIFVEKKKKKALGGLGTGSSILKSCFNFDDPVPIVYRVVKS